MKALFDTGVEFADSWGVGGPMCASPDMVGVPGGSSFGPPNGEPRSVKFNVVKGLLSTLIEFGGRLGHVSHNLTTDYWPRRRDG